MRHIHLDGKATQSGQAGLSEPLIEGKFKAPRIGRGSGAMQRRLAAVLAADVSGYSRLMGADEIGTLGALKAHRRELVDPCIAEHHGRIVKTTGDGMLL